MDIKINRKWTSVTDAKQTASETVQDSRKAEQIGYDTAQEPNRNPAKLAEIEAKVGARSGGKVISTVPGV